MKTDRFGKTVSIGGRRFFVPDLVFAAALAALGVFFVLTAPYGITESDETLYQFYSYRLSCGDKLFVDDWMISNLFSVFTYLPFRVYTAAFGGTEGLALAMRYLYVAVKLILFAYIYLSLRSRGLWAVLADAVFVGTDLFGLKALSYYSVCVHAVLLAGMLLFVKEDRKNRHCVFAGFLFACAVVAEPTAALVWLVYSLAVLLCAVRKKRGGKAPEAFSFILGPKIWALIFAGICAAALTFVVLCAFIFTGRDLQALFAGLKEMLKYVTYSNGTGGDTFLIRLNKPLMYVFYYGVYFAVPFAALWLLTAVPSRLREKHGERFFAALCVLFMLMSVHLILYPAYRNGNDAAGESVSHPLLLVLLAFAAYAVTAQKNKKLFAFLTLSAAVSVSVDLFSNNSFGSVLLAGAVPAVLLLEDCVRERLAPEAAAGRRKKRASKGGKAAREENNGKKTVAAILCALTVFLPSFEAWHYAYMARMHETERFFCMSSAPLDARISTGILKGVYTTAELRENYEKSVRDAKRIGALCERGLIVVDYDTTVYMNAGVKAYAPATHIVGNDWGTEEAWWAQHPDKRPDVAYIPYFTLSYIRFNDITAEEKLSYFRNNADVEVTEGEIGYIVKITRWH